MEDNITSKLQKLTNLYSILRYGYKSTVDKLAFDRVGKSVFKWWLIKIPDVFPALLFRTLKLVRVQVLSGLRHAFSCHNKGNIGEVQPISNLHMHPIAASVGMIQLRKLDHLNGKRIEIARQLQNRLPNYYMNFCAENTNCKHVYTNFPFWFVGHDIHHLVTKCKLRELLLRKTWPAKQNCWSEQYTKHLRNIRDNLLLLSVSPMLTNREIDLIVQIITKALEDQQ